jgi:hypothetical protein
MGNYFRVMFCIQLNFIVETPSAYIVDLLCKSKRGVDEQSSHKMVSIHFKRQNSAELAPVDSGAIKPKNNLTGKEKIMS